VRPGLHDFFNGLVWLRFPLGQAPLNRCRRRRSPPGHRRAARAGARRDHRVRRERRLAAGAAPLWEALEARDWRRLFVELRPLWREARLLVFGHALLEKLAAPRKDLTAHVWRCRCCSGFSSRFGRRVAGRSCTAHALAAKPFTPLPVLGVPGWWPGTRTFPSMMTPSYSVHARRQNP
jgi:hypothetical protein